MADRKDLPPPTAANFLGRVREEMMRMMGKQGERIDQVVTVRDLVAAGLAKLKPSGGFEASPDLGGSSAPEQDLTPPPTPSGFALASAISHVLIEHDAPTYTQGGGHGRTRVYGVTHTTGPLPTFAQAVELGQFSGTVWAMPSNPATTWRLWIKWETADGVVSAVPAGGTNGLAVTTGQDVSKMVQAMTGAGNPFTILTAPTTIGGFLYPAGTYSVQSFIIDSQITNAKIADLAVDNAKIASMSVDKLTAGSLAVGQWIQSTSYTAGSAGWRINADGTAELNNVTVRGTVFASAGNIGGITIASNAVRAGQTAFNTGLGFYLGSDGKLSLGNSSGNRLTWDGVSLSVVGGGTFSGSLSAATGTFAGSLSAATGTFSGSLSAASGTFSGSLSGATGTFSGALTASAINAVDTINIANNAVTVPVGATVQSDVSLGFSFSWQTAASVSINTFGQPLYVSCMVKHIHYNPGGRINQWGIMVNGVVYASISTATAESQMIAEPLVAYIQSPPSGNFTVGLVGSSGGGGNSMILKSGSVIFAIGLRR